MSDRHDDETREYSNGDITVVWQAKKCMHSGICFAGLRQVFNPKRRPWVDLTQASTEQIVAQVNECPSGALSLKGEAGASSVMAERVVEVTPNGPLLVFGNVTVKRPDGSCTEHHKVTAFCRCGASGNKPFCDGSHQRIGFKG
ncbi:MAG: (4Fe-4S)-binding protein [Archangium sp.]|nr:(4Fe-4S)-binding protein [Archangium sp.]